MRKLISVLAALALVGSLAAQKGKKAAKAPAAPAVAAPKVPAMPSVPAAAAATKSDGGSKFIISAWGGYNIGPKSDLEKASEAWGDAGILSSQVTGLTKTVDATTNGVAGGLDLYYGGKFQFGLGAYYLQGFKVTRTLTGNASGAFTATNTTQLNFLPIVAQIRYFVVDGLYVGVGGGVAVTLNGKSEASVTGTTLTGLPYSDAISATAIIANARLGYQIPLGEAFAIDIFGLFTYSIQTVSFKDVLPGASGPSGVAATDYKNSGFNITPALALTLKF